jgi:hypothetical protein
MMNQPDKDLSVPVSWKNYLFIAFKFLLIFYISTLCVALFFIHRGENWLWSGIFLGILYLFVMIISLRQMLKKLPMAAIMLAAPTIPLFMLILVVSLIPILQMLN